jgi:hypothetical protein
MSNKKDTTTDENRLPAGGDNMTTGVAETTMEEDSGNLHHAIVAFWNTFAKKHQEDEDKLFVKL